jgi:manganese-dependent ADP-ribose/CDP-alcohol diphosphatase
MCACSVFLVAAILVPFLGSLFFSQPVQSFRGTSIIPRIGCRHWKMNGLLSTETPFVISAVTTNLACLSATSDEHDELHHGNGNKDDDGTSRTDSQHEQQQQQPPPDDHHHNNKNRQSPIVRIGMLADIQYADVEDGFSYSGNPRYYRHALHSAVVAADHFQREKVDVVINLGDTVDGKAGRDTTQLDAVVTALHGTYSHGPILHVYGNHCLYNADRHTLREKLGIPMAMEEPEVDASVVAAAADRAATHHDNGDGDGELVGYYSHVVGDGGTIKLVVIDSYDIYYHRPTDSAKHIAAIEILKRHNGENYDNDNANNPPASAQDLEKRFVAFNGAVGSTQLAWLRLELQAARESRNGQKVILLSHQPILPGTTNPVCLIWNYHQVLDILEEYEDVVLASFAGHTHKYGYEQWRGIHFMVVEAVLEAPPPHHSYCIVDIYRDDDNGDDDDYNGDNNNNNNNNNGLVLQVHGHGKCQSATYRSEPSLSKDV